MNVDSGNCFIQFINQSRSLLEFCRESRQTPPLLLGASSPLRQALCSKRTYSWPDNPCDVEGIGGGRDNTIGSKERLRCNLHPYERIHACPHLPVLPGPSLRKEQHSNILVNVFLEADWPSVIEKLDFADVCPCSL